MTPTTTSGACAADTRYDHAFALGNASTFTVKVSVSSDGQSANIEPQDLYAQGGDTVRWLFENVPSSYEPMIQFTATASTAPATTINTGPMRSICREPNSIRGVVRKDASGEFLYHVVLIPRPGLGSGTLDLTIEPAAIHIGVDEPGDPQSSG